MSAAYGVARRRRRHPLSDRSVVLVAICAVGGVWAHDWRTVLPVMLPIGIAVALTRRVGAAGLCVLVALAGCGLAQRAWSQAAPRHLGGYEGWAQLVGDPAPFTGALRVTLEIEGERFDAWVYGSPKRRLASHQSGDQVYVEGTRVGLTTNARRAQVRHVVGRFDVDLVGDSAVGSPLQRASSRVRQLLRDSAEATMPHADAALFTGLVIGDDGRQAETMITAFRTSGLSHLTAVSGQNVAYLLAAVTPLLRRLRPWARWAATVGLIGWFMALTRFEPSVLRAGAMAMFAATGFVIGRQQRPIRLLALAVIVLIAIDPLLVWSVGFWLSVGATAGVCVVGTWLSKRLPGPRWLASGLGITLGAQVGVVLPSWLVFDRLPLVSIPANLLAVPVAGFVMLVGLPTGIVAAWLPHPLQVVLMVPATVGTRWVSTIAVLASRLEPAPAWSWAGWAMVALGVALLVLRGRRDPPPVSVP